MTDFARGETPAEGYITLKIKVDRVETEEGFFVVNARSNYNVLLGRDWIHSNMCISSTMHQMLILWREAGEAEIVQGDPSPFGEDSNVLEAMMYDEQTLPSGAAVDPPSCNIPMDRRHTELRNKVRDLVLGHGVLSVECIYEDPEQDPTGTLKIEDLKIATGKLGDDPAQVQDALLEVNLGSDTSSKPIYISANLDVIFRDELITLLREYKDCFAWSYAEIPGLDKSIVEHKLPLKDGFRPFRQPPQRMSKEVEELIREEINWLKEANFIREAKYTEWLSNIVPVMKKNGKLRVCVDFRNLNLATPKDEYPMPIADMLIDGAAGHTILSFLDAHSGYNQVPIHESDISKTAFRCPGPIGAYEWIVMPFGLKNAGATYQRTMNKMFEGLECLEVYIDDVVVKSSTNAAHLADLRKGFERICTNEGGGGVEVDKNKAKAIINVEPPKTKKQLQRLIRTINFLRRFISNTAGRLCSWSVLLKGNDSDHFVWTSEQQQVFDELKKCLVKPPIMMPPKPNQPLLLYISAAPRSLGCMLAQEDQGVEKSVYYLSRALTDKETRYSYIEKLCLCLYFTCCKLRYYMLPVVVYVLAQTDVIKYILSRPYLRNQMGKRAVAMSEFTLVYVPQKAVKGHVLADFLADHPGISMKEGIGCMELHHWKLWFDGSRTDRGAGAGIVIVLPSGARFTMSCSLNIRCTNNQDEYEALVFGLEILMELGATPIQVWGDSMLVIKQVAGEYKCESELLIHYCNKAKYLIGGFSDTWLEYKGRSDNMEANDLAQHGSGYKPCYEYEAIQRDKPNLVTRDDMMFKAIHSVCQLDFSTDWRKEITKWFKALDMANRRLRTLALNYIVLADELYKRGSDGLLFRCIGLKEAMLVMAEVHEGIVGAHQAGPRMRWLILKYGFYWPKMEQDCIRHAFVIVATDYYSKLVEAIPLKSPSQESVIKFFREYIILRHGLPETITTDQGAMFTGSDITEYAEDMGFRLVHSTPYYAQANGQAEATNKAIKGIIQKTIVGNPK
ncbi:uncharacterized protein LOC126661789 [Mercurialis annua]|uniref:uncharacterized protein LOC126661789 n=1 Tax=Mercurialis annua TaxID=3986 RepID=UPI002160F158|nr:uncharacterized protein LOC126661789 [Mercurialis annua]